MTLGTKLQNLRKHSDMSQEALAGQIGVSRQAVSRWELDISLPETENIIKLAKLFKVSFDYLLDEDITEINKTDLLQTDTASNNGKPIAFYVLIIIGGVCAYFGIKFLIALLPLRPFAVPALLSSITSGKSLSDLLPTAYAYALTSYTPIILLCISVAGGCFYMANKISKNHKKQ